MGLCWLLDLGGGILIRDLFEFLSGMPRVEIGFSRAVLSTATTNMITLVTQSHCPMMALL